MSPVGGVAGFPFTSKDDCGAFTRHWPVENNMVMLFAPHIGIDSDGTLGRVTLEGGKKQKTCESAISCFNDVLGDELHNLFKNEYMDHQMLCIKNMIEPYAAMIDQDENSMSALVFKMYELIQRYMEDIISLNWQAYASHVKVAVVGGIIINCDGPGTDMFLPIMFQV